MENLEIDICGESGKMRMIVINVLIKFQVFIRKSSANGHWVCNLKNSIDNSI